MKRTIGPVTSVIGAVTAAITVACWLASVAGYPLPSEIQAALTLLGVYAAGWAVSPSAALQRAYAELYGPGTGESWENTAGNVDND